MVIDLEEARRQVDYGLSQRAALRTRCARAESAFLDAEAATAEAQTAQQILQEVAREVQRKAHTQVASVVSKCLAAVFPDPYELVIEFERRRGKTEADFYFVRDGKRVAPACTSGAVRQVTSLALRLASLVMLPGARLFLALDEPFAGLDAANLARVAALVSSLAAELGVQMVICTHLPGLKVGKVVDLTRGSSRTHPDSEGGAEVALAPESA